VGRATHYHADWMVPYWRDSLVKVARVGTHLFYLRGRSPAARPAAEVAVAARRGGGGGFGND
jgi:hypothetical protein